MTIRDIVLNESGEVEVLPNLDDLSHLKIEMLNGKVYIAKSTTPVIYKLHHVIIKTCDCYYKNKCEASCFKKKFIWISLYNCLGTSNGYPNHKGFDTIEDAITNAIERDWQVKQFNGIDFKNLFERL